MAKATSSNSTFRRFGLWSDIRRFLEEHRISEPEFANAEIEIHKVLLGSFEIQVTEEALSSAQFVAVKVLGS